MCAGYIKNNCRCTCAKKKQVNVKETMLPRDIRDVIDLEPLKEFRDTPYRDDVTDAYEYIQRISRYNFE